MAGHSKWKQIKHKKGAADKKRGQLFSKLLKAISVAAKDDPNPQFNPRLRSAIEKAKENNVPQDNISKAVTKASEIKDMEDLIVEAYGPEGIALIVEIITDNRNRSISEIRTILGNNGGKMANPGSVLWSFEKKNSGWEAKFPQPVSKSAQDAIQNLLASLEEHDDVQKVITNAL